MPTAASAGLLDLDFTTNVGSPPLQEGFTEFAVYQIGGEFAPRSISPSITVGDVTFSTGLTGASFDGRSDVAGNYVDLPYTADDGLASLRNDYLVIPKWDFLYNADGNLPWRLSGLSPLTLHTLTFYFGNNRGVFMGSVDDPANGSRIDIYESHPDTSSASIEVSSDDDGVISGEATWDGSIGALWAGFSVDLALINPTLPGDANSDGAVDLLDLDILGENFGLTPATSAQGDFNEDELVDLLDLDILGAHFGQVANHAVPEPSTALLLVLVGCRIVGRNLTARR